MVDRGLIAQTTLVREEANPDWCLAAVLPELHFGPANRASIATKKPKWRFAYVMLALFLGGAGIHNFYIGRWEIASIQLAVTLLSLGTLWFVVFVWVIVETFTIKQDAWGRDLT